MSQYVKNSDFEHDQYADWKTRVEHELKGKAFEDYLLWKALDGFQIEAWQNSLPSEIINLPALPSAWKIIEPIYQEDAQKANEAALSALNIGAEGIWFNKSFQGAAAEVAINKIDQSLAPVFINGTTHVDPFRELLRNGAEADFNVPHAILDGSRLRERGASVITELSMLIAQGLSVLYAGLDPDKILFKVSVGTSLLTETAKIRALRWLWSSVLRSEGLPVKNPSILAVTNRQLYASNDEHTNILRATSGAMSAVFGGAAYIMIEPWDRHFRENQSFSKRISRNIQVLLKEEARLDKNLNPVDGSFFLENLSTAIAKASWQSVQEVQSENGFISFAKTGRLKEAMLEDRNALLAAYQSSSRIMLGVNKYNPANPTAEETPSASAYKLMPDYLHLPFEIQNQAQ